MSPQETPFLTEHGAEQVGEAGALEVLLVRDCLGGERVVELRLPRGVELGDLDRVDGCEARLVMTQLPRPFFRLDVPGAFTLTGILTDPRIRFTVRLSVRENARELAVSTARRMLRLS